MGGLGCQASHQAPSLTPSAKRQAPSLIRRAKPHQVYEELSPAVCGVLQGQYVCVMAYGQTGAGKTFTMQVRPSEKGVRLGVGQVGKVCGLGQVRRMPRLGLGPVRQP